MRLPVGTRILHVSGRTGVITFSPTPKARAGSLYYRVALDEPKTNPFEPDEIRAYGRDITPLSPKLHERYEAEWAKAAFIDRSWTAKARA